MPDYDVIIIGAGPAGSASGIVLSEKQLKVLMVDEQIGRASCRERV